MDGKWLFKLVHGCSPDKCVKPHKNRHRGQSTSVVKPVEEKPPEPVSDSSSNLQSAAASPANNFQGGIYAGDEDHDVDLAAGVFIDKFHRDLKLQRTPSEARYYEYLARSR